MAITWENFAIIKPIEYFRVFDYGLISDLSSDMKWRVNSYAKRWMYAVGGNRTITRTQYGENELSHLAVTVAYTRARSSYRPHGKNTPLTPSASRWNQEGISCNNLIVLRREQGDRAYGWVQGGAGAGCVGAARKWKIKYGHKPLIEFILVGLCQ